MGNEHLEIKKLVKTLNNSHDIRLLSDFADMLEHHIRFEERTVFPEYEVALSNQQLDEIGEQLGEIHHKTEDDYPDKFWT